MPLWGGFRIGVESSEPNTPPFVIVNVPPESSCGVSVLSRARCAMRRDLAFEPGEIEALGVAHDRHHEPALRARGDAEVDEVVVDDVRAADLARSPPGSPQREDARPGRRSS